MLTSKKTGKSDIRATVKSYTIDTMVVFQPALPQDLMVSADLYVVDTTQSVKITALLSRDPFKGQVSDPVKVFYAVTPDNPQPGGSGRGPGWQNAVSATPWPHLITRLPRLRKRQPPRRFC